MWRRHALRTTALAGALATATVLSGCGFLPGDGPTEQRSATPAPWVRGAESVVRVESVGDRYIALRVTDDRRFELVSISGTTGRIEKRRAIDPLEDWDPEGGFIRLTAGGGALAYDRETDMLDVLDPVTFEPRWSHRGYITDVTDCGPHVCVTDAQDETTVLDQENGAELWSVDDDSVFTVGQLVKVSDPDDSSHLRVSGVDPDTGKVRWSDQPTKRFGDRADGFGYRSVTDDRGVVTAVDDDGHPLGFSMYDMRTGERLWSRTGLEAASLGGEVVAVAPDRRSLRYLDPETGKDRFTVRAPTGHTFADEAEQAVDTVGKPWLALRKTGSKKVAFAPVDEKRGVIGDVDAGASTVVLSSAAQARTFQVVVDGKTETIESSSGFRVMSAGTGEPAAWSGDAPLPEAVTAVGDPHPFAIDAEGFPILERVG
ncbi:MAG: PQQ-binding-like beta-propeller repeat protein [Streptosporangiales bacterium]|nr:PQQ-binding-like beta-propeller repeat protein [Streptosporangiales bacterium]